MKFYTFYKYLQSNLQENYVLTFHLRIHAQTYKYVAIRCYNARRALKIMYKVKVFQVLSQNSVKNIKFPSKNLRNKLNQKEAQTIRDLSEQIV
jgi:hypothetical protein